MRSNQNRPAISTKTGKYAGNKKELYLYLALTCDFFASPADYWLKTVSRKSHRVLLKLGQAPDLTQLCRDKIMRLITGCVAIRDEMENTVAFDAIFTPQPATSKQKEVARPLEASLGHAIQDAQNKKLSANVIEILRAAGVERRDIIRRSGKQAGQSYVSVSGVRAMGPVDAWNYGVKLYHEFISENEEPDSLTGSKRKADDEDDDDDDDEPVVVEPPAKRTLHSFFGKGKTPVSRA